MNQTKIGTIVDKETGEEKDQLLNVEFYQSKEKRQKMKDKQRIERQREAQKFTVYVKNYPQNFSKENFEQLFGRFGTVKGVYQHQTFFALVSFESFGSAQQAIKHLNGKTLNNISLIVK